MAAKPETNFRKKVTKALKTLPNTVFFPIQQKAIKGDPDFMLCINGKFVALELKSAEGKVSVLQRHKLDRVKDAGGVAFSAFPKDWEGTFSYLQFLATRRDS